MWLLFGCNKIKPGLMEGLLQFIGPEVMLFGMYRMQLQPGGLVAASAAAGDEHAEAALDGQSE